MKVVNAGTIKRVEVRSLKPGDTILNSSGNLCMVIKDDNLSESYAKVRLVNLASGAHYTVDGTCSYEVVQATATWNRSEKEC